MLKAAAWLASVLMTCWHFSSLEGSSIAGGKATLNQAQTISKTTSRLSNAVLKDGQLPYGTREEGMLKNGEKWKSTLFNVSIEAQKDEVIGLPIKVSIENLDPRDIPIPLLNPLWTADFYKIRSEKEIISAAGIRFLFGIPVGKNPKDYGVIILNENTPTLEPDLREKTYWTPGGNDFLESEQAILTKTSILNQQGIVFALVKIPAPVVQSSTIQQKIPYGTREEGTLTAGGTWTSTLGVAITASTQEVYGLPSKISVEIIDPKTVGVAPFNNFPVPPFYYKVRSVKSIVTPNFLKFSFRIPDGERVQDYLVAVFRRRLSINEPNDTRQVWTTNRVSDFSVQNSTVFYNSTILDSEGIIFAVIRIPKSSVLENLVERLVSKVGFHNSISGEQLPFGTREAGTLAISQTWTSSLGVSVTAPAKEVYGLPSKVFVEIIDPKTVATPMLGGLPTPAFYYKVSSERLISAQGFLKFAFKIPQGEKVESYHLLILRK